MPMNLLFLSLFIGIGLLWFSKKGKRAGKIILTVTSLFLFLVCLEPFTSLFMKGFERTYPSYSVSENKPEFIWVLGSGFANDPEIPLQSRICYEGMYRIIEGIRIYKMTPGAKIVFSGYGGGEKISIADIGAEAAISLGVPESDIITVSSPKDTGDEAKKAKEIINDKSFVLVTSASHMKRAMYIFNNNGLKPLPAPCGHYVKKRDRYGLGYWLPSPDASKMMHRFIYEQLGLLWIKTRALFPITSCSLTKGAESMTHSEWQIQYIGSSESYSIYRSTDKNRYILQIDKPFERIRYSIEKELKDKVLAGSNLIDDIRRIIEDDSKFIADGQLVRVNLPDTFFDPHPDSL